MFHLLWYSEKKIFLLSCNQMALLPSCQFTVGAVCPCL